jgi:hypothetical protein
MVVAYELLLPSRQMDGIEIPKAKIQKVEPAKKRKLNMY